MKYHYPDYYRRFICTGGDCEDTCCAGWQIGIDKKSYGKYKKIQGAFGKRLRAGIDHRLHVFRLRGRTCTFFNIAGYCDIYRELGRDGLCRTCRTYPRHVEDFGELKEVTLSLSCPEAARLILGDRENGKFLEKEYAGKSRSLEHMDFLELLSDIRQTILYILKNRGIVWEERLAMILTYTHDVQARLPRKSLSEPGRTKIPDSLKQEIQKVSQRYLAPGAPPRFSMRMAPYQNRTEEQLIRTAAYIRQAWELEPVVSDWRRSQEALCRRLYHAIDMDSHIRFRNKFASQASEYELEWENLIIYFINTFFLGAVYDGDLLGKIKMTLYSYIIIRENCFAASLKKGGITKDIIVSSAYRYSREVENSNVNLDILEQQFNKNPLFATTSILTVLLGAT